MELMSGHGQLLTPSVLLMNIDAFIFQVTILFL
jgi:hypothetical protein